MKTIRLHRENGMYYIEMEKETYYLYIHIKLIILKIYDLEYKYYLFIPYVLIIC